MDDGHDITPRTDTQQLLRVWLSPSFPIGAYAYSHGLESAVARGLVKNRADLEAWLRALLRHGSARTDHVLLVAAWGVVAPNPKLSSRALCPGSNSQHAAATPKTTAHAIRSSDISSGITMDLGHRARDDTGGEASVFAAINALALALQPSAERYLETSQQGGSFVTAITAAWPCASIDALRVACADAIAYPVALGVAAAGHDIGLTDVLDAYALAFVQNSTSAAIRLSIIGQTDAQRVIAALMPDIAVATRFAATSSLDVLGAACFSSDLTSLEHETLPTRLFRS